MAARSPERGAGRPHELHGDTCSQSTTEPAVRIASRCSFETQEAFRSVESDLQQQQHESFPRDIRRRPTRYVAPPDHATTNASTPASSPVFITSVKSVTKYALTTAAARSNDHTKTKYKPPSDFSHRVDSPPAHWKVPHTDFQAKFHLTSNQDLRSRTALDQEGFFSETSGSPAHGGAMAGVPVAATQLVKADEPGARRSPSREAPSTKPDFQTRLPHTSRKSSNVELRLETIVDQHGLLPQLTEIRNHDYRNATGDGASTPFLTKFKPAPSLRPIGSSST